MPSAGDTAGMIPQRKVLKLLFTTAAAIALGVFEELADPFGLDTQSDRLSADIFVTITSPFYGQEWGLNLDDGHYGSRYGQSNVIVLLIDDYYLQQSNQSWPLDSRHYERMLRKLVDAGASAVFVDIWFALNLADRNDDLADLYTYASCLQQSSICEIHRSDRQCRGPHLQQPLCDSPDPQRGTEIIFASTFTDPEFRARGDNAEPSIAPLSTALAELESNPNFYRLVQAVGDKGRYESAAWSTYQAWCLRDNKCAYDELPQYEVDRPMFVHWGNSPNEMMTGHPAFGGMTCQEQSRHFLERAARSFRIFWVNLIQGFDDAGDTRVLCPYTSQINLQLFNTLSASDLRYLFEGKAVLIGASLEEFPDWQYSPVHGYVPGVFLHAMAVDNLVEFGSEFKMAAPQGVDEHLEAVGLTVLFLLQGFFSWIILRREAKESLSEPATVRLDLLHGLLVIVVISATVLWMTGINRWAPANWIGFAMLMFLIDHKPIKALPRFCWMILPTARLTRRPLRFVANIFAAVFLMLSLLFLGYCLFIAPHALILAREPDDLAISWLFMAVYLSITVLCAWKITLGRLK